MELIERLIERTEERTVVSAHLGDFTTAVVSSGEDGWRCGLASSLEGIGCEAELKGGCVTGMRTRDLACLAAGSGPETSLGMAAINSSLPRTGLEELNAAELIEEKGRNARVAVIGHFHFTERLRAAVKDLMVFELRPRDALDLPAERMAELLPSADVVALTGLTLLNGTFLDVLSHCRPDAFKVLLGPSVPLSPVLFDYGIDAAGGVVVSDIPALVHALTSGVHFRGLPGRRTVLLRKR